MTRHTSCTEREVKGCKEPLTRHIWKRREGPPPSGVSGERTLRPGQPRSPAEPPKAEPGSPGENLPSARPPAPTHAYLHGVLAVQAGGQRAAGWQGGLCQRAVPMAGGWWGQCPSPLPRRRVSLAGLSRTGLSLYQQRDGGGGGSKQGYGLVMPGFCHVQPVDLEGPSQRQSHCHGRGAERTLGPSPKSHPWQQLSSWGEGWTPTVPPPQPSQRRGRGGGGRAVALCPTREQLLEGKEPPPTWPSTTPSRARGRSGCRRRQNVPQRARGGGWGCRESEAGRQGRSQHWQGRLEAYPGRGAPRQVC